MTAAMTYATLQASGEQGTLFSFFSFSAFIEKLIYFLYNSRTLHMSQRQTRIRHVASPLPGYV